MSVVTRDTSGCLRTCADVRGYVKRVCFKTGPPGLVGVELEWLLAHADDPGREVSLDLLRRLVDDLPAPPCGSRITFEPGGQLELSSAPARGPSAACRRLSVDVEHLRRPLEAAGLVLLPTAIDPRRHPRRQLDHPRYAAMEQHFAALDQAMGPVMMNSTVATQVNLDIGADPDDAAERWRLLNALGPAMVAAFANSPVHAGEVTGWKSTRQHVWQSLSRRRTSVPAGDDPVEAWTQYALEADLMLLRRDEEDWSLPPGRRFHDLLADGAPSEADLGYHLTTLFPPVRPRGWYEVRYLDALPLRWWPVPAAVLSALVEDPVAAATAREATAQVADRWSDAAHDGLSDPALREAATACFEAAGAALWRTGADRPLVELVESYDDTYVRRGRCPADDDLALEAS